MSVLRVPVIAGQNIADWVRKAADAINGQMNRITDLDARVTQIETDAAALDGRVTAVEGSVATLQADMTAAQGAITALQSDVATLQNPQTIQFNPTGTPGAPGEGMVYFDSTTKLLRYWNGATWVDL